MAKNKNRKSASGSKNKSAARSANKGGNTASASRQQTRSNEDTVSQKKVQKESTAVSRMNEEDILYQVKTKKDSGLLKSFITFTYRVMHPRVSARLVFYGLLVILPGIFYFRDLFWKIFFIAVGAALILLGFFRQYISLAITKRNDPDYKSGAEFTYNFSNTDGEFLKNGEIFSGLGKYKNIAGFYHDDDYLYMSLTTKELIVMPKKAFTIGDSDSFEEFIYKKSRKTCHWLPDNFKDQWKQRRAARSASASQMKGKK